MAVEENTRYSDLCRLCATKTNLILAINIFEGEGAMREINKKIETCLPIQVHESDQLPKMICEDCLYKIELFFDFREQSVRTENMLITLLKEINKEVAIPLEATANMIMIQQPLLNREIQNEIDLSQLQQRNLIVEQEIILSQSNPHLTNINLDHEEAILVDHKDVRYPDENLLMQQEHLLTDQYRLHIGDNPVVDDLITENSTDMHDSIICKEEYQIIKTETFKEAFSPVLSASENGNTTASSTKSKDDEWFHCNMCGRSFKDKNEFETHYEDHFNKCAACLAVFTNREALNEHRKEMHGSTVEETKPIKTRLKRATVPLRKQNGIKAGSNSDSEGNQENMVEDEDEDDPEEVVESPTNRRKKWTLKECKECGKTYKTNYKLAEHMRKHTGEKPYKCGSCEKAFRSKIGLAQHEAKHTDFSPNRLVEMDGRKRKQFSVEQKVAMFRDLENGKSQGDVCREQGLSRSTLSTMVKNKETILAAFENNVFNNKRLRKAAQPDVEEAVLKWFVLCRSQNVAISRKMLHEKAIQFSAELGVDFKCSDGWLYRFKKRHNISAGKAGVEVKDVSSDTAERWLENEWPDIRKGYEPANIFNANEMGLFFRTTLEQASKFKNEKCVGGKLSNERITVLVCVNMTGDDKRKLLVIGDEAQPSCFQNVRSLPVNYVANATAWMTSEIFNNELRSWDTQLTAVNRKVLLLVDSCAAHPHIFSLKNIKLAFLPPNTTSVVQPMDHGIVRSLKCHYRKELVLKVAGADRKRFLFWMPREW